MEEMKLWAELTMSVQKEETKSSTESDGAFTSALCKAVGTQRHRVPSPPTPKTTPRGDTDGLSPALLQSPIPTPHGHRRAPLGLTPTHSPIPRRPPPPLPPGSVLPQRLRAFPLADPHSPDFWPLWQFVIFNASLQHCAAPPGPLPTAPRAVRAAHGTEIGQMLSLIILLNLLGPTVWGGSSAGGDAVPIPELCPLEMGRNGVFGGPLLWPRSPQRRLALRMAPRAPSSGQRLV